MTRTLFLRETVTRSKSVAQPSRSRESLVWLLLFQLLFVSLSSSTCLVCIEIHLGSPHTLFSNSGHQDRLPECDRDCCSCCGFQLMAQHVEPQPPQERIAYISACSPVMPLSESIFTLEHPPRS